MLKNSYNCDSLSQLAFNQVFYDCFKMQCQAGRTILTEESNIFNQNLIIFLTTWTIM